MRRRTVLLGVLWTLFAIIGTLSIAVLGVSQSESYYVRSFKKYQVWEESGVDETDALRIARALPRYLTGDRHALSLTVQTAEQPEPAFHAAELSHMEDVYGLIVLSERLLLFCSTGFFLLSIVLIWKRAALSLPLLWRSALGTLLGFAAFLLLLAIWAVVDFSSIFVVFHRIAFSNDLWQMNPATDLMIRLMPQGVFADGALGIAWRWVLGLLAFLGFAYLMTHSVRREPK